MLRMRIFALLALFAGEILTWVEQNGKIMDAHAKANGFTLMLDQRSLVFAQGTLDVTDEILKLLNSRAAAPSAPAAARQ